MNAPGRSLASEWARSNALLGTRWDGWSCRRYEPQVIEHVTRNALKAKTRPLYFFMPGSVAFSGAGS